MRTLSAGITAAQVAPSAIPYISLSFVRYGDTTYTYTTADSANRIKYLRHEENPYDGSAVVVLENHNRDLPDLLGYQCNISYGYVVAGTGDTTGGQTAPLWVKKQFHTSKMGSLDTGLYLQDAWVMLTEMTDIASVIYGASGAAPLYQVDYAGSSYTIYDVIEDIVESARFTLYALGAHDDSIVDTLEPDFVVNTLPFESASELIYRLINMTYCFVRAEKAE